MIKITNENIIINGHQFDYQLENGELLHESEWDGERYTVKKNGREIDYKPIYIEEDEIFTIIGFEMRG